MRRAASPAAIAESRGWPGRRLPRPLWAGLAALVVAIGIGRFLYTPLLPAMQAAGTIHPSSALSNATAGAIASTNYLGYLMGALTAGMIPLRSGRDRRRWVGVALWLGVCATLAMGVASSLPAWFVLRGVSGLASGWAFVWVAALLMDWMPEAGHPNGNGWLFAGVGVGIALTGLVTPGLVALGGWRAGWWGMGLLAVPIVWWAMKGLPLVDRMPAAVPATAPGRPASFAFWGLVVAYALEGLGYVVMATFITAFFTRATSAAAADASWVLVGLAATPSVALWGHAARRWGVQRAVYAVYVIEGVGVLLPVFVGGLPAAGVASVLFGGTFLGVMGLILILGRAASPQNGARTVAQLTVAFGVGQLVGPAAAGWLTDRTHAFQPALLLSALVLLAAPAVLWIARRPAGFR